MRLKTLVIILLILLLGCDINEETKKMSAAEFQDEIAALFGRSGYAMRDLNNTITNDFYRSLLDNTFINVAMLNQKIEKTNIILDSCLREVKMLEEVDTIIRYRYETIKYIKACKSILNNESIKSVNIPNGRKVDIDVWIEYRKQFVITWSNFFDATFRIYNTQVSYLKRHKFDLPLGKVNEKESREEFRLYKLHTDSMIMMRQYNYPIKIKNKNYK